jgi:hypothetical protein
MLSKMMRMMITAILMGTSLAFVPQAPSFSSNLKSSTSRARLPVADFKLHVASTRKQADKEAISVDAIPVPSAEDLVKANVESTNPLVKFSQQYQQLQKDYYLPMAFAQSGFLASCADMATQTMEVGSIDFGHVAAMIAVASTMSGVANAFWLRQLEENFPGTGAKQVFYKTTIHATIVAGIINSVYLAAVPFLATYVFHNGGEIDMDIVTSGWSIPDFLVLTKIELGMFVPYNIIAFKFISPTVRPLTHALMTATFNVAVSAVTLGYFDMWIHNFQELIS